MNVVHLNVVDMNVVHLNVVDMNVKLYTILFNFII
jgi:hypothetical protein